MIIYIDAWHFYNKGYTYTSKLSRAGAWILSTGLHMSILLTLLYLGTVLPCANLPLFYAMSR